MYANGAGEARPIVQGSVAVQGGAKFTGKRKGVTGGPPKGRRLTVRQRTAVVTGGAKEVKKRWMIHLQDGWLGVL